MLLGLKMGPTAPFLGYHGPSWTILAPTWAILVYLATILGHVGTQYGVQESSEGADACEMAPKGATGAPKLGGSEGFAEPLGAISADLQNLRFA